VSGAATTQPKLGRGAVRTFRFLLDQGGWWDAREMCRALELTHVVSLLPQLRKLMEHKHIVRKGDGVAGSPYRYGVTAACVPVPGVTLAEVTRTEGAPA
jgi:hypothetical protein